MLKTLIIDDETKARNIIHHYIRSFIPEITEVKEASNVDEALQVLGEYKPDLVFLDVEMPFKNGFDFLITLKSPTFDVIFTTAYNQYAIQAIRFSALDYLLKPIDPDELKVAVERHLDKKETEEQKRELYSNLVQNVEKKSVKDFRLAVPSAQGVYFFTVDEIVRLEADSSYTFIHLKEKKPFLASKTLKHFEEMLEGFSFIRTHKSHLINANHIKNITSDHDNIVMSDGSSVEISRRKKGDIIDLLRGR